MNIPFFRKKIKKIFFAIGVVLVTLLVVFFVFRGKIGAYYFEKKIESFRKNYPASLTYRSFRMKGLSSVLIRGLAIKPFQGDTLITIDSVMATFEPVSLIFGKINMKDLMIRDVILRLNKQDSLTNYMFLLEKNKREEAETDTAGSRNYASTVSRMFNAIFDKLPSSMDLSDFRVLIRNNGHLVGLILDRMTMRDHFFRGPVRIIEENHSDTLMIAGMLDKHYNTAEFRLYSNRFLKVRVPFIDYRFNTGIAFDTLVFTMTGNVVSRDLMTIKGVASVKGLVINNDKIAEDEISFENLGFDYLFNFGKDYAELDSSTTVTFNQIDFHPYIRYRPRPTPQITLQIHKNDFPAQQLFSSVPRGLFTSINDIRVKGNLSYNLDFFVDLSNPDSLIFESEMKRKGFAIISYGQTPLTLINGPFLYTAYEKGQPVRSFMVGPVNEDFRPIDRISPYLKIAVLTGEDPSFYQHGGFLMDAFRESIATNLKQKRFARGGSTITMQLVKNVYLSRNKTVGRKIEEMLITWLLETQHLASKDRMFEVYLNIIEWGPMVYGANEAARFYFNKDASRLNLAEAIFLASIVPHPKWWKSSFTPSGSLRPSMTEYYRLVSGKMLRKGQITQSDYDHLVAEVELRGRAKEVFNSSPLLAGQEEQDQDQELGVIQGNGQPAQVQTKSEKPSFFRRIFGWGKKKKANDQR